MHPLTRCYERPRARRRRAGAAGIARRLRGWRWVIGAACLAAACTPPDDEPQQPPAISVPDFSVAGLEPMEVADFLAKLKRAVAARDQGGVAALAAYPLDVTVGGERRSFASATEFEAAYSTVVTEPVEAAVAATTAENAFVNYQGVRIGRGELWFGGVYPEGATDYVVAILTINTPQ